MTPESEQTLAINYVYTCISKYIHVYSWHGEVCIHVHVHVRTMYMYSMSQKNVSNLVSFRSMNLLFSFSFVYITLGSIPLSFP